MLPHCRRPIRDVEKTTYIEGGIGLEVESVAGRIIGVLGEVLVEISVVLFCDFTGFLCPERLGGVDKLAVEEDRYSNKVAVFQQDVYLHMQERYLKYNLEFRMT